MTEEGLLDKFRRLLTGSATQITEEEIPQAIGHPMALPTSMGAWAGTTQEGIPIWHVRHVQVQYKDAARASPSSCDARSDIAPSIRCRRRKAISATANTTAGVSLQLKRIRELERKLRTAASFQLKTNRELELKLRVHYQTHMVLLTVIAVVALLMCIAIAALFHCGMRA